MSNKILRAALYPRVSTEEQKLKGFSIDAQMDALTEYCADKKIKIVDFYNDEGVSGAKPPLKRPGLNRLLEDVKAGKIDIILFTKLDRWFRSVKEYFKVQEILDDHKVAWKAIHEDYDTTTANGQMAITIFLAVAQNERDKTAERIQAVLEHKRKNKEACFGGNAVPLGYKKEKDVDGIMRLVKDPELKDAMQEFWNILIDSNNLNKAIRYMTKHHGIERDWKSWSRLTQSDFYCGIHRGVQDFCEAYVTPEQFLKYQESRPVKATPTGTIYFFKGLMRCPGCGHKLCGDSDKRKETVYKSYRCVNRCRGCNHKTAYTEKKLEKQLLENIEQYTRDTIAEVEIEMATPRPKNTAMIAKLKERRRRNEIVYMAGNKTDEAYLKEDAELKLEISRLEESEPKPRDLRPLKELLETDFKSLYLTFGEEAKQEFWLGLLKEIYVEDKKVVGVRFFD